MSTRSHPSTFSMPEDVVLSARGVTKKFCLNLKRSMAYGIKDLALNMVGVRQDTSALRRDEFWALRDVTFDLRRGEVLGLIGVNGSGKTTLLRLLAGIFPPDSGEIAVRGRIGALIALGAGFHPYMTGRENIHLNGAILGLTSREIAERLDSIITFADIGAFIDAPVSTYSSGMRVKLGFAIAINVQCDLLLIDEVLAVGDIGFRIKCMNAVRSVMAETAVVFVSHSMLLVSRFCTRIIVMEQGQITYDTPSIDAGIDRYLSLFPTERTVAGTGGVEIKNIRLHVRDQAWSEQEEAVTSLGDELKLSFDVKVLDPSCESIRIDIYIMDQGLVPVVFSRTRGPERDVYAVSPGMYGVRVSLGAVDLNGGKYSLVIVISDAKSRTCLTRLQGVGRFRVVSDMIHWGHVVRDVNLVLERTQ